MDTWKRKADKQKVEKRLKLSEFANAAESIRIEDKRASSSQRDT